jgi:hypothetical protein
MDAPTRRLGVVSRQLAAGAGSGGATTASLELQMLLEHDNHDLRRRMTAFLASDELYVPRCVPTASWLFGRPLQACSRRRAQSGLTIVSEWRLSVNCARLLWHDCSVALFHFIAVLAAPASHTPGTTSTCATLVSWLRSDCGASARLDSCLSRTFAQHR